MSKQKKRREWWEVYELIGRYLVEEVWVVSVWGVREREERLECGWGKGCVWRWHVQETKAQAKLACSEVHFLSFPLFFSTSSFFKFSSSIIAHYNSMIFFHPSNFFFLNNCTLHNNLMIFFLMWVNFLVTVSLICCLELWFTF